MYTHRFSSLGILIVFMVSLLIRPAAAQDPTQRELELEQMVKELLQRVEQLENRMNQESAARESLREPTPQSQEPVKEDPNAFKTFWKNGLNFETNDGSNKLHIGGRIQLDTYAGSIDEGEFPDGVRFRRVWTDFNGILLDDFDFRIQYDISGDGITGFKDVYLGYLGLDYVKFRLGQFKEPFSLEEITSSNYLTFMERSPVNLFAPSRETGLMLYNDILDNRMSWAVGLFKNVNEMGDGEEDDLENGDWDVTARLTGLPWYEDGGKRLLHLGLAGAHREWSDDPLRLRARGSFSKGDRLIDTGNIDADSIDQLGAELALVYGPASLQAEYVFANVEESAGGSSEYDGFYIEASYFLTGESRPYKNGAFSRVIPKHTFSVSDGGWGAWQTAFRYSHADLTDTPTLGAIGGTIDDYALGLNWHLNPNMRLMWNYIHSESSDANTNDQDADVFQMRMQLDF